MRIGRTLSPAAAPIGFADILAGLKGISRGSAQHQRFITELRRHFGTRHIFLVSSGKAALTLILQALHDLHPERDHVLIPAYTCYSVPSAITRAGLKVAICDVDPDTLDFDRQQLFRILSAQRRADIDPAGHPGKRAGQSGRTPFLSENGRSSSRLLAVIPTHLYGRPAGVTKQLANAVDPDVTVIEDAAQAMGGVFEGRKIGTLGHVGFFSLGRGKAFSTVEGGIILTDRDDIAQRIDARLSNIPDYGPLDLAKLVLGAILLAVFTHPRLFWVPKALPFLKLGETIYDPSFDIKRMSAFQVGLATHWQIKLQRFQSIRSRNSRVWTSAIRDNTLFSPFSGNGHYAGCIRYPMRIKNAAARNRILEKSRLMGLGIMAGYPDCIAAIDDLNDDFREMRFPGAEICVQQLVTLPVHVYVTQADVSKTVACLRKEKEPS